MRLIMLEARKMFIHKRGVLFIAIYLLATVLSLVLFDQPYSLDAYANNQQYSAYLQEYSGALTSEKESRLAEEYQKINDAEAALGILYSKLYDGIITQSEFEHESAELEATIAKQKGFDVLYNQYIYVREDESNRFFVSENGWSGLLASDSLDILLVILVLLLVTPMFCYEYESSMDSILVTARKGGAYQALSKIALAFGVVAGLCVMSFLIHYAFYGIKYGLADGAYPLQSLSYFGTSTKSLTIIEACVQTVLIRIFGYVSFAIIVMFLSQITKKYAVTVFGGLALILLPYIGLSSQSDKYLLPLPLGFMTATGFFRGIEFERDLFTDEMLPIFSEVPPMTIILISGILAAVVLLLAVCIIIVQKNKWAKSHKRRSGRHLWLAMSVSLIMSALTSCGNVQKEYDIWNHSTRMQYENEHYAVYADNSNGTFIAIENKATGEIANLVRDPFTDSFGVYSAVYGNSNSVYYVKYGIDNSGLKPDLDRISVIEVNLENFSEKVIIEQNINRFEKSFLGLISNDRAKANYPWFAEGLFVDDTSVFIVDSDLWQIDRMTNKAKRLDIPTPSSRDVAFDGENILYINNRSEIVKCNLSTETETAIQGIAAKDLFLTGDEILYTNRFDGDKLYVLELSTGASEKLLDIQMEYSRCDGRYIYFGNKADGKDYRVDMDGENVCEV